MGCVLTNKHMKKIPSQALSVLHRIQTVVPQAIVSGGCLRDYFLKRPINDIDIFVPANQFLVAEHAIIETCPAITETFGNLSWDNIEKTRYYKGEDFPINLIGVYNCTPAFLLESYDFGFCKIAFDGQYLWKDAKFDLDANNETITLYTILNATLHARSLKRYECFAKKYVNWRFVDASSQPKTTVITSRRLNDD